MLAADSRHYTLVAQDFANGGWQHLHPAFKKRRLGHPLSGWIEKIKSEAWATLLGHPSHPSRLCLVSSLFRHDKCHYAFIERVVVRVIQFDDYFVRPGR